MQLLYAVGAIIANIDLVAVVLIFLFILTKGLMYLYEPNYKGHPLKALTISFLVLQIFVSMGYFTGIIFSMPALSLILPAIALYAIWKSRRDRSIQDFMAIVLVAIWIEVAGYFVSVICSNGISHWQKIPQNLLHHWEYVFNALINLL